MVFDGYKSEIKGLLAATGFQAEQVLHKWDIVAMASRILTFGPDGFKLHSGTGMSINLPGQDATGVYQAITGDLSRDGVKDVVVARDDGTFAWTNHLPGDAKSVEKALELPLPLPRMAGMSRVTELAGIGDANGDGRNDVLFSSYLLRSDTPTHKIVLSELNFDHIGPIDMTIDLTRPVTPVTDADDDMFHILPWFGTVEELDGVVYITPIPYGDDGLWAGGTVLEGSEGGDAASSGPVNSFAPPHGRVMMPAKQYYGVDTETGEVYTVWNNQDANAEFVAFGELDGREGLDVLFKDKTTGELYAKIHYSDKYFVSGATSNEYISVAGLGNFHGDGGADEILFFDATTREFSVWVRPPFDPATSYLIGIDYFKPVFKMDRGWDLLTTTDVDGDGIDDIVIANVGDFAVPLPGWQVPLAYFSSARQELVQLGSFDHGSLIGFGNFFDGPSIL